jgi:hypothetical protein
MEQSTTAITYEERYPMTENFKDQETTYAPTKSPNQEGALGRSKTRELPKIQSCMPRLLLSRRKNLSLIAWPYKTALSLKHISHSALDDSTIWTHYSPYLVALLTKRHPSLE